MTQAPSQPGRWWRRWLSLPAALSLAAGLLLAASAAGYYFYFPSELGQVQPIPFSHRFHVAEKKISCFFCHTGAIDTARAGVPPLETCILCHKKIIIDYPQIVKLREYYDERKPVDWVHVNVVQEFVYFDHSMHIRAGFDCSKCHGDVAHMDRIVPPQDLNYMGFCVQCHRDEEFSHDCLICHR